MHQLSEYIHCEEDFFLRVYFSEAIKVHNKGKIELLFC